jgi:antitoxin (DNA-binding transcriptional repressor) of toxin-antitoxin stability system
MKSIAVSQFKVQCLSLLEGVARTGQPLLVLKRGKPLARVLPGIGTSTDHPQDTLRGTVTYLGDLIDPPVPPTAWESRLPRRSSRAKRR